MEVFFVFVYFIELYNVGVVSAPQDRNLLLQQVDVSLNYFSRDTFDGKALVGVRDPGS